MIITFVGHGSLRIDTKLSEKIVTAIRNNVKEDESITFYCGGYGDFDHHCASVCKKLKTQIHCEVIYVTPYFTPSPQEKIKYLIDAKLYDSTVYPPIENVLPRYAITKRNEWMVSEADLVIAYVSHTYGGAYKTLQYARKKKKNIINLAE